MADQLVVLDKVAKRYPDGTLAVSDISLHLGRGEVVGMIGRNGAGKSTMLNMICGLTNPTGGSISFGLDRGDIAWCTQLDVIDWSLTVEQNVALPLRVSGLGRQQARELAEKHLAAVDLLDDRAKEAENLSGGQLRRTQIARALAGPAGLIVMDEPASGLDILGAQYLYEQIRIRASEGAGVVISSHDIEGIEPYIDRIVVVEDGGIVHDGDVAGFSRAAGLPDVTVIVQVGSTHGERLAGLAFDVIFNDDESSISFAASTNRQAFERLGQVAALIEVDDFAIKRPSLREAFLSTLAGRKPSIPNGEIQ